MKFELASPNFSKGEVDPQGNSFAVVSPHAYIQPHPLHTPTLSHPHPCTLAFALPRLCLPWSLPIAPYAPRASTGHR